MVSRISRGFFLVVSMVFTVPTFAVDWSTATEKNVTFFYPGSASWEKLLTKASHDGASGIRSKTPCRACHDGDEANMGRQLASETQNPLYRPHVGVGSVEGSLQIAIEGTAIYFKIVLPHLEAAQVSLLLDNSAYMHSSLSGCWSSCHDDLRGMDSSGTMDLTKYLSASRSSSSRTGGGENYKTEEELRTLFAEGQYLELMGVGYAPQSSRSFHGTVLAHREQDESGIVSSMIVSEDDKTSVVLTRPLESIGARVKAMKPGGSYALGLSLHPGDARGADHLVTLEVTFDIDESGRVRFAE